MPIDLEKEETASRLRGSLREFTKFFTKYITSEDYIESQPVGRESHQVIICRELTSFTRMEHPDENLLINVEPGSGKTWQICMWIAWCYTHNPKCNFIYISYAHTLAAENTAIIKRIMSSRMFEWLFDVKISSDTKAKDHFATTAGGHVAAFGSGGAVTGRNAGLPGQSVFSGAVVIDDPIKPDDAASDVTRQSVIKNFEETIRQRPRGENVPIIFIGQRVHQDDLAAFLIDDKDIKPWRKITLKSLDDAGNALYPEVHSKEHLLALKEKSPYTFSAQFQQEPVPAGGSLFEPEWFLELDKEPKILATFITADTAETEKTYNDATAISMWGVYEIEVFGKKTGELGLHWLDCIEEWVEPKDLERLFLDFWLECSRHPVVPRLAFIEKKSTGVTLISTIKNIQGIGIREIERGVNAGSKSTRFINTQTFAASKRVTFTRGARHVTLCKNHMMQITANNTHRKDDICFVAGTKIATKYGYKNIEDIKKGDKVITPFGYGIVTNSFMTGEFPVIEKIGLTGTPNHPVYTGNKFASLDTLADDASISLLSLKELLRWNYLKALFSTGLNITSWGRDAITLAGERGEIKEVLKDCTLLFGNFIIKKKFRKAFLFITKIITHTIIALKIWSVFHAANILKIIGQIEWHGTTAKKAKVISRKCKSLLKHGIAAMKAACGIAKTPRMALINCGITNAGFAMQLSQVDAIKPHTAQKYVTTSRKQSELERSELLKKPVYNITVERYGVYYANNILVSNCDTYADACRIALIDKAIPVQLENKSSPADDVMNTLAQQMRRQTMLRNNRDGIY